VLEPASVQLSAAALALASAVVSARLSVQSSVAALGQMSEHQSAVASEHVTE
jgi:hypothetical protein